MLITGIVLEYGKYIILISFQSVKFSSFSVCRIVQPIPRIEELLSSLPLSSLPSSLLSFASHFSFLPFIFLGIELRVLCLLDSTKWDPQFFNFRTLYFSHKKSHTHQQEYVLSISSLKHWLCLFGVGKARQRSWSQIYNQANGKRITWYFMCMVECIVAKIKHLWNYLLVKSLPCNRKAVRTQKRSILHSSLAEQDILTHTSSSSPNTATQGNSPHGILSLQKGLLCFVYKLTCASIYLPHVLVSTEVRGEHDRFPGSVVKVVIRHLIGN